jgi:IS5 family transposase
MKPRPKPQGRGTQELYRAKLRNIINLQRERMRLGELIDWKGLETHFAPYDREAGRPGLPIRLIVGLHLLKPIEGQTLAAAPGRDAASRIKANVG